MTLPAVVPCIRTHTLLKTLNSGDLVATAQCGLHFVKELYCILTWGCGRKKYRKQSSESEQRLARKERHSNNGHQSSESSSLKYGIQVSMKMKIPKPPSWRLSPTHPMASRPPANAPRPGPRNEGTSRHVLLWRLQLHSSSRFASLTHCYYYFITIVCRFKLLCLLSRQRRGLVYGNRKRPPVNQHEIACPNSPLHIPFRHL